MLFLEFQQTMDTGGSVPELMGMRLEVLGEVCPLVLLIEYCSINSFCNVQEFFSIAQTSSPASLCYLDNGVVFVGSTFGDSQLVKVAIVTKFTGSNSIL